jgi:hypothetical protein
VPPRTIVKMPDEIEVVTGTQEGGQSDPAAQGGNPGAVTPTNDLGKLLRELVDERREFRKIMQTVGQQPVNPTVVKPPATKTETVDAVAALSAQVADMQFEIGIRDAISAAGVTDPKAVKLIRSAAKHEKPGDLMAFVTEYAPARTAAIAAVVAPVVKPVVVDGGAPIAKGQSSSLPSNPYQWSPEVVAKATAEEVKAALDATYGTARNKNPYQGIKRPHERTNK